MTDFLKEALDLTKAQASVRTMTEEEMMQMITKLASKLQSMSVGEETAQAPVEEVSVENTPAEESSTETDAAPRRSSLDELGGMTLDELLEDIRNM